MFDLAGTALGQHDLFAWLLAGLPCPEKIVKVEVEGAEPEGSFLPHRLDPRPILGHFRAFAAQGEIAAEPDDPDDGKPATQQWELAAGGRRTTLSSAASGRSGSSTSCGNNSPCKRRRSSPCRKSGRCSRRIPRFSSWKTSSSTRNGDSTAASDTAIGSPPPRGRRRRSRRNGSPARQMASRGSGANRKGISWRRRFARPGRRSPRAIRRWPTACWPLSAHRRWPTTRANTPSCGVKRRPASSAEALLRSIDPYRALVDPLFQAARPSLEPSVLPLLATAPLVDADFARRHPYAPVAAEGGYRSAAPAADAAAQDRREESRPAGLARRRFAAVGAHAGFRKTKGGKTGRRPAKARRPRQKLPKRGRHCRNARQRRERKRGH